MVSAVENDSLHLDVVYPKRNARIAPVDSTFIFGSTTPGSRLIINGVDIPVHRDGGYLAFLPLKPGRFVFEIMSVKGGDTLILDWPVTVSRLHRPDSYDTVVISSVGVSPGDMVLSDGDWLRAGFYGTPGCRAWFTIPSLNDSLPMAERPPSGQAYWGEVAFGAGAADDQCEITGCYEGFMRIKNERLPDPARIVFHLKSPTADEIMEKLIKFPAAGFNFRTLELLRLPEMEAIDSTPYHISINPPGFPRSVVFTDSVQIIRVGPRKGYLSIFQPAGIRALAVGRTGEWIKLRLSPTQSGWVNEKSVAFLEPGLPPPVSYLTSIRIHSRENGLRIEMPLSERHPFRIEEEAGGRTLNILLYGVFSDTDWIRYDLENDEVEIAAWAQIEPELYSLKLHFGKPVWGYDAFYDRHVLKLDINKPPQDIDDLEDKIIVVDPGHSPDPGAVGPTGLRESEINLHIALALASELEDKGARVILTRDDMSPLELYDRPKIAKEAEADLFISIHNNALPDGVNPFENHGSSVYYYHQHSYRLARAVYRALIDEIGLKKHGLYHGNLAVARPTQYPAILIECMFMMLPEHEARLKDEKFQEKLAEAIRKGIEEFLDEYDQFE